jgi:hypothetical protein
MRFMDSKNLGVASILARISKVEMLLLCSIGFS